MCEFYLHSLILPHPYSWNPNPYLVDVYMMAFASWPRPEEMREEEFKKYKEEEEWANMVKDKGYHEKQAITRYVA